MASRRLRRLQPGVARPGLPIARLPRCWRHRPSRRSLLGRGGAKRPAEAEPRRDLAVSLAAAGMVYSPPPAAAAEGQPGPGPGPVVVADAKGGAGAVVLLRLGQTLTLSGRCLLTCLYGSVRVFGFSVVPEQPSYQFFSPHSHSALTVEAVAYAEPKASERERKTEAKSVLRVHLVPRDSRSKFLKHFAPQCSVVLLEYLDTPLTKFILSYSNFSHIFRAKRPKASSYTPEDALLAMAGVGQQDPASGLVVPESMCSALEQLIQACQEEDEGCPVLLVCGPKGVGKSTFNRYLVNLLLNCLPCVGFLDCDLGQPEFTPPGCVSLIDVTEPLLGPPFTHQRTPRKMVYYGETSCEQDTERYIDTLKYVFSAYERDVPLVINTMGWVKGDGLLLLLDIVRLLEPSHVVQISAADFRDMPRLSLEYLHNTAGLHTRAKGPRKLKDLEPGAGHEGACLPQLGPKLLCVHPEFPGAGDAGLGRTHSSVLRDLAVLGYLSQLQPPGAASMLPLSGLTPYQVPFSGVALRIIHEDIAPAHVLYAVNASWVGLCQVPDELPCNAEGPVLLTQTPMCNCLGFGIVRGVDIDKKLYYILTPVAPENLRLVNCLLIGNIPVPNCVFLNQMDTEGEIPYVTSEYNYSISGAGKLKIKKHLKRREHYRTRTVV
uniref:Polynucleotide 5'-hydroxyl-kinase NOL9 n=1 Tax=Salvator merianae TaxID=96440 RepID=A0A8D0AY33_SALMN